ncbi:ORF43 [Agrotis segetum granulovirus]|uniref:ORF43 n=1 Tax=Agrotis segetum granulosis virus TaxID=10464 RepID=Q6QXK2_GVAS|nr:pif-2 [Agrotis segetum granulovirus]AAS82695.1 ORF43 [Agrotis segetum granulovirus]AHN92089.1 pif-2 [Agrotis segetum granulovirus]AKN63324.1 pif-2 [Agrotis segetum granulovirus]
MWWPLFAAIIIALLYLLYRPLQLGHHAIRQHAFFREEILNDEDLRETVRRRRYAPLHTLPNVKWDTNFNTLEGSNKCFNTPTLVTVDKIDNYNCAEICDNERAVYFFVEPHDRYVVDGQMLISGGYCTTNSLPRRCNAQTSLILQSANQWSCIAEDPRFFAGANNSIQQAGRQHINMIPSYQIEHLTLWDNELNRIVNPFVNNFRRTWDDLMQDGRRRFEVKCNALDVNYNQTFNNPLNPIECLPNVCSDVRYIHRDVHPDFEFGLCDCGDYERTRVRNLDFNPTSKCASIVDITATQEQTHNFENNISQFRVECMSLDTPITLYSPDKPLCPPEIFNSNTDFAYTFLLRGTRGLSQNGMEEPTFRLWTDTKTRINWTGYGA